MLTQQRQRIDQIDQAIVELFEERTRVVEEVAAIKLENNIEILDTNREEVVINKVQGYLKDPTLNNELADLYENLMRISREHQQAWINKQPS